MSTTQQFTRDDVLRIVGITPRQLGRWERLRLLEPRDASAREAYGFGDIITLRTVKQLTDERIPPQRLRRVLVALERQLGEVKTPLAELRVVSDGGRITVEYEGARLEPFSGQLLLNFDAASLSEKVRSISRPGPARAGRRQRAAPEHAAEADEWFATALDCEENPDLRPRAIEAYRRVIERQPGWVEPRLNLGTLLYEQGDKAEAAEHFRRAVALDPANSLAHFDLGSALEDLGQFPAARQHLSEALRLEADYADAHYNLARVCDKLGAHLEARRHWRRYV
ncbi:MAG: tetratricopeptide repeat protein, partial [Pseudomonadota bacterium]